MRLLLDQNLSSRLTARLGSHYSGMIHVADLGLSTARIEEVLRGHVQDIDAFANASEVGLLALG